MEHLPMLSMKEILTIIFTIVGIILTPILGLLGMMWYHFNGQFKEISGEMKEIRKEMKDMESRLAHKIDSSHQSLEGKISKDRERISHIEGYLQLSPTTHSQVEIAEKITTTHLVLFLSPHEQSFSSNIYRNLG